MRAAWERDKGIMTVRSPALRRLSTMVETVNKVECTSVVRRLRQSDILSDCGVELDSAITRGVQCLGSPSTLRTSAGSVLTDCTYKPISDSLYDTAMARTARSTVWPASSVPLGRAVPAALTGGLDTCIFSCV